MTLKFKILTFLFIMSIVLNTVEACPGCKFTSQTNNGNIERVQKGFSFSVLFLLLFPLGLMVGVGRYTYKTIRKVEIDREEYLAKLGSSPLK